MIYVGGILSFLYGWFWHSKLGGFFVRLSFNGRNQSLLLCIVHFHEQTFLVMVWAGGGKREEGEESIVLTHLRPQ